jgi:hypothetical protein
MVKYGMPDAAEKPSILPKGFTLPAITLPVVLPTDAVALTALLHSVIQAHDASNQKAHKGVIPKLNFKLVAQRGCYLMREVTLLDVDLMVL